MVSTPINALLGKCDNGAAECVTSDFMVFEVRLKGKPIATLYLGGK